MLLRTCAWPIVDMTSPTHHHSAFLLDKCIAFCAGCYCLATQEGTRAPLRIHHCLVSRSQPLSWVKESAMANGAS